MSREPTALLLAAFLVTFVLTRTYTRLARVRGWGSASANGVHVHHLVVGIVFILLSGLGVLLAGLFLVGLSPFGVYDGGRAPRLVAFILVAASIVLALITFAKGKLTLGVLAVFIPPVGLVGALRLGKPRSLWARRFYRDHKRERARQRFENSDSWLLRWHERFDDFVGGPPTAHAMFAASCEAFVGRMGREVA